MGTYSWIAKSFVQVIVCLMVVGKFGQAQVIEIEIPDLNQKQAVPKLDHPALQELRAELKRVQASAESWGVKSFEDPLEQKGPSRADRIPSLRLKSERRRTLAQRYLKEPLKWSGVAIKNGSMLSFFGELLGPIALEQTKQLQRFHQMAASGGLSIEDQERYEVLREVHGAATFPVDLVSKMVFTRQIHGQAQSFSFDKSATQLSLEPMPLGDWPSQLLDRLYTADRKRVTECRMALIDATRELAAAERKPDADNLDAAFTEWDKAGKALMKSVDMLAASYSSEGVRTQRTLNHAHSDAKRFLERLRHSAARLIAERNVEAISFSPQTLVSNTSEYSAMDLLAFLEGNGLSFGRAHASSEEAHRKLAIAVRDYYSQVWSLQEVQRRSERELEQMEAIIEEQQQHEETMMQMVALAKTAEAVAEIARTQRKNVEGSGPP